MLRTLAMFAQVLMRYASLVAFFFAFITLKLSTTELTGADWVLIWIGVAIYFAVQGSWHEV